MIWALLAILGVPIWLILGALGSVVWSRRRFAREDVFPISIRSAGRDGWPRMASYGRLVHDVLVVNRGLALVRTEVLAINDVHSLDLTSRPKKIEDATARLLSVDGHDDIEIAVPSMIGRRFDELA